MASNAAATLVTTRSRRTSPGGLTRWPLQRRPLPVRWNHGPWATAPPAAVASSRTRQRPVGTVGRITIPGAERAAAPRWAHRSWAAVCSLFAFALVWVVLSWAGVLVVVASFVVPVWAAAPALVVAGTAARVGLGAFRTPGPARQGWCRRALPAVTTTAWVLVSLTAAFDRLGGPSYVVAEPAGSGGCRAVVV